MNKKILSWIFVFFLLVSFVTAEEAVEEEDCKLLNFNLADCLLYTVGSAENNAIETELEWLQKTLIEEPGMEESSLDLEFDDIAHAFGVVNSYFNVFFAFTLILALLYLAIQHWLPTSKFKIAGTKEITSYIFIGLVLFVLFPLFLRLFFNQGINTEGIHFTFGFLRSLYILVFVLLILGYKIYFSYIIVRLMFFINKKQERTAFKKSLENVFVSVILYSKHYLPKNH